MKCFVLAGGSGDALWPLSRKNYPKQFMNFREGRSLFQEAIARNLPFCDQFYIITNVKYRNIVEAQLQVFQGLSYRLFLEEVGKQTAPAIAMAALCTKSEEEILVVSTDHMIGAGDYNHTVMRAKELLTEKNIVVVGCPLGEGESANDYKGHNGFIAKEDEVTAFVSRLGSEEQTPQQTEDGGELFLDSGIFMMTAGAYLKAVEENAPYLYDQCLYGTNRIRLQGEAFLITKSWLSSVPSMSVGDSIFTNWAGKNLSFVKAEFIWKRLLNLETLEDFELPTYEGNAILTDCKNVEVLSDNDKLVVANACEDLLIVNSKDAIYISKQGCSDRIRDIMSDNYEVSKDTFDEGDIFYTNWGVKEILSRSPGYMVRKVTIFPGKRIGMHKHNKKTEHWSVVEGTATVILGGKSRDYGTDDSVFVPIGVYHELINNTAKDLVMIEVGIGVDAANKTGDVYRKMDDFIKLAPSYKDYIWGGTALHEIYGMNNPDNEDNIIAESWCLSAHSAGPCVVIEGNERGRVFPDYLHKIGKEALGWKCQPFDRFPLLVKFIDAAQPLSVQVHPDDAYAMAEEDEYGKNEMWYILNAEKDAALYVGFEKKLTRDECCKHIEDGTLTDVLHRVPVKKGDVVFVKAGTVHAILAGVRLLEIQQSSNCTYRLYDYNRLDKNGNPRPLHLIKALENMSLEPYEFSTDPQGEVEQCQGYTKQLLGECKYFSATLYEIEYGAEISLDDASFSSIVFIDGEGDIFTDNQKSHFKPGDSYFVPAGKKVLTIVGASRFVLSRV